MKRISLKIIMVVIIVFIVSTIIPRFIASLFETFPERELFISNLFFFGMLFSVALALILSTLIINSMIVKRIKNINNATEKVTNGDYNIMIDVHGKDELSQLSQRFNKMVQALNSNEYLNKSFVRNFSHELKTPLAAIKGYADMMIDDTNESSEMREYAIIISDQAQRLSNLTQHLLQLSLLDSDEITPQNDCFNLAEQIRNVIQLLQLEWENKKIHLELNLIDKTITSNKALLYQVWKNLVENAVKFTPNGGHIIVQMEYSDDNLIVQVQNDGVLVLNQDIDHLTEIFYVTNPVHKQNGSGIGLSIVKRIIHKLGGTISFNTNEKDTFETTITLPLKPTQNG